MKPSQDAVDLDYAHKVLRQAIGTPQETLAREYLRIIVERVKAKAKP